jgi:hypothetical protein
MRTRFHHAALALALLGLLALALPAPAGALPRWEGAGGASWSPAAALARLLDALLPWSLEKNGATADPDGATATSDSGATLDPDGATATSDSGATLDPDGATATSDNGATADPNGQPGG